MSLGESLLAVQPMEIDANALAALLEGGIKALPNASAREIAEFTVRMYLDVRERGLSTHADGDMGKPP